MRLDYEPLLEIQRDLYRIPLGPARFRSYLRVMLAEDGSSPRIPPLVALNPMAKGHVAARIDDLLGLDAEGVARRAASEAAAGLPDDLPGLRIGLVVADDAGGGWTNRYASEFAFISGGPAAIGRLGWLTGVLWSSEPASVGVVREAARLPLHRMAYILRHGRARTLRDFLGQEGHALAAAGCGSPRLDAEDLDYTQQVLEPLLGESLPRTIIECLYGDEAARTLGFTPRGLSHRAGLALALALHRARPDPAPASPADRACGPGLDRVQ